MTVHLADAALRTFWNTRRDAAAKNISAGKHDTGQRGSVTAGQHLDAVARLIGREFINAGCDPSCIRYKSHLDLPGFFRPSKKWDIVVIDRGVLVAAVELKSHVGPSFGNNFNNRAEEAIGNAVDVRKACEDGAFPIRPWLGYFFVLEEAPGSIKPIGSPADLDFPMDAIFQGTSYRDRYGILCKRLVQERLYDAVCFLTTVDDPRAVTGEPDPQLGFAAFTAKINRRVTVMNALLAALCDEMDVAA